MSQHDQSEFSERRTFMGRFGFAIGGLVLAGIVVAVFSQLLNGPKGPPPRKQQEMVMIKPPPPPPPTPPPPPPPPQDAPKQEMMEQTPIDEAEAKPEPAEAPSASIGTNIVGNGPADGFGLGSNKGGFMGGSNGGRANRSQFGWYANQVIKSFGEALSRNPRTQNASFNIKARIWADAGGRVTRAKLVESTGDSSLDAVLKNEILTGFQLKEPPPDGMPMPIVMRLSARRPI